MHATRRLLGASRLPLTTKRGNKDYYKGQPSSAKPQLILINYATTVSELNIISTGTRQAYVPGEGRRTGPPGKFVIKGKAKYQLVDEQVRYFVSPGAEILRTTEVSEVPSKPSLKSPLPIPYSE